MGLVLVVANSPRPGLPQLAYGRLARELGRVAGAAVGGALAGAALAPFARTFVADALGDAGVTDPLAFLAVQGAHAGTYVGAAVGTSSGWRRIRAERARSRSW